MFIVTIIGWVVVFYVVFLIFYRPKKCPWCGNNDMLEATEELDDDLNPIYFCHRCHKHSRYKSLK